MLSRVAENLFWIGRYIERAENVSRLVDAARRMVTLPTAPGVSHNEWTSVLIAAGASGTIDGDVENVTGREAIHHLIFNTENPSSVTSCLSAARENGRAIRFALTQECWEALNTAWAEMRQMQPVGAAGHGLPDLLDWIKSKSAVFRGAMHGTMLRGDGYDFVRMGNSIERSDSTARLLDVKYNVLLPSVSDVGSGQDHYQWLSLLQAASAQRAYFFITKDDISARGVAKFLILEQRFPRSIVFNIQRALRSVKRIEDFYDQPSGYSRELAGFAANLSTSDIDTILSQGLHEFLTGIISRNNDIANALGRAYGFASAIGDEEGVPVIQEQ